MPVDTKPTIDLAKHYDATLCGVSRRRNMKLASGSTPKGTMYTQQRTGNAEGVNLSPSKA